jgi:nitric oxide reductase subunit B
VISFVLLLAGIGALAWYYAAQKHAEAETAASIPAEDPLLGLAPTPSMQATRKYFWTVAALLVVQVGLGAVTAHYGVEGSGFYGIPLGSLRGDPQWHLQLGIFWIATAWLATGLFIAPAVSGVEPAFQRLGVNVLFVCLLIIVVGSMAGQWFAVQQRLGLATNFWFGHQGYEYVDLGRFWQLFLFAGLWLLAVACTAPCARHSAAREERHSSCLLHRVCPVVLRAGLMGTPDSIAEYWRWWAVHLWVEGFSRSLPRWSSPSCLPVWAAPRCGQRRRRPFSTLIFLAVGLSHVPPSQLYRHAYCAALGATFALEVVPPF